MISQVFPLTKPVILELPVCGIEKHLSSLGKVERIKKVALSSQVLPEELKWNKTLLRLPGLYHSPRGTAESLQPIFPNSERKSGSSICAHNGLHSVRKYRFLATRKQSFQLTHSNWPTFVVTQSEENVLRAEKRPATAQV